MIKKLRYLFTLLFLVIASVTWAEDVTVTMTSFTEISGYVADDENISYEAAKGTASTVPVVNNGEIRVYQNGGTFTISSNNGALIKSVTLGSSMKTSVTYAIDGGSASESTNIAANSSITVSDLSCSKILFTCVGTDKNSRLYVNNLSVTYTPSGAPTLQNPGFSFSAETAEAVVGEAFTAPTFSNPNNIDVTFASSNTSVATVNDAGAVTIVGAGTTEISATSEATDTYKAGEASYTLTVTEPLPTGMIFYESFNTNEGSGGNDGSWSGSIASSDFKSDNEGWSTEKASGANHCVKAGTGSAGGSLTTPEIPFETGKNYVLTFKAGAWNKSGEGTTLSLSASSASISVETVTMVMGQWTEYTVYINNVTGAGTISFYTSAGNNRFFLDEVTVAESDVVAPSISANDVEIAYDATSGSISFEIMNPVTGGSLTANTNSDWLTLGEVGESSIPYTANVNESASSRTADVVLTYTYGEENITKTVTVTQAGNPNQPGTQANPYTVAQARAAIDAGTGTSGVYATGIVSAIPTAYSTQYKNITFNFVDEVGDDVFLQAYRCGGDEAANVEIGDIVVVYGNLTKYNSTYEFASGCQLISLTHPDVAVPTFSPEAGVFYEAQKVSISCETEGATIKYSTDNATWADYTAPIAIAETTTIYAKAVKGTSESIVASAKYEIRDADMKGGPNNPYTVAEALEVEPIEGVYVSGIISEIKSIDVSRYERAQYYISDDGTTDNQLYIYNGYYLNGAAFTANDQIQEGDVVTVYGNLIVYNDVKQIDQNGYIVSLERPADEVPVIINAAATDGTSFYGTMFYSDKSLVVPQGAEAYTYTVGENGLEESWLYEAGDVIPAATGVVIKTSTAGEFKFVITTDEGYEDDQNMLSGSDEAALTTAPGTGAYKFYMLSLNKKGDANSVGFYFANSTGAAFTNGAHKAYLVVPASVSEAKGFPFGDDATGIEGLNVNDNVNANEVYDLQGRRMNVNNMPKGIYIVNGKKVVIK